MLEAKALTKNYGNYQALKGIDLHVQEGEIFCLLGANGAGKSTTINLFLGFIQPTSGTVYINGIDVSRDVLASRQYITYIPENLMLYTYLSGYENLQYFCKLSGKSFSKEQLENLLTDAGLQNEFIHKRITTYSKGMRQKVGVALAMAKQSKVLLLDEPTSGLDPKASNEFSDLLLKMKENGVATLMATHDIFRARETGTKIGIMKNGELVDIINADAFTAKDLEALYLKHMHN